MKAVPDLPLEAVKTLTIPTDDCWFSFFPNYKDICVYALTENWEQKFKEGASFPRKFVINATPKDLSQFYEEIFVLFKVVDYSQKHNMSQMTAQVNTTIVCTNENTHEVVLREFMSWMKEKSCKEVVNSLEEVVDIAAKCFNSFVINKPVFQKPSKGGVTSDVFLELSGWKSESFSLEMAQ